MADKVREILAANMKRFRASFGYSQMKLAEIAELSTSHVAAIETCSKFPSSLTLIKLADAFGIEPYQLFQDPSQTPRDPVVRLGELKEDLKLEVSEQIESYFRRYLKDR